MRIEPMQDARDLPYVDQHAITIEASPAVVWTALERFVAETLASSSGGVLGRVLGADPPGGFAIVEREHERRLVLAGRHRFARYRLTFELEDAAHGSTVLRAVTHAIFPDVRGRVYRSLVIGSRLHVLATRGMLHAVRRRSLTST